MIEVFRKGPFLGGSLNNSRIRFDDHDCYKILRFREQILDKYEQIRMINQYNIFQRSHEQELKHVMKMTSLINRKDHVGIQVPRFEMNLREYLQADHDQ